MKTSSNRFVPAAAVLLATCWSLTAAPLPRDLPQPLTPHPGNIFVAGEDVVVPMPKTSMRWRLVNHEGQSLGDVTNREGKASLSKLDVGFYRLEPEGGGNWICR